MRALLDTGASHTFIPLDALLAIYSEPVDVGRVEDYEGRVHDVELYPAHVIVPEQYSSDMRVYATTSEALIGRDILDLFRVTFDGPAKEITNGTIADGRRRPAPSLQRCAATASANSPTAASTISMVSSIWSSVMISGGATGRML